MDNFTEKDTTTICGSFRNSLSDVIFAHAQVTGRQPTSRLALNVG